MDQCWVQSATSTAWSTIFPCPVLAPFFLRVNIQWTNNPISDDEFFGKGGQVTFSKMTSLSEHVAMGARVTENSWLDTDTNSMSSTGLIYACCSPPIT